MNVESPLRRLVSAAGAALAIAVVLGANTHVQAQAGPATIRACIGGGGSLRLVGPSETCKGNDQLVVWNVQGPAGPAGPAGPSGATGATGPEGPAGRDGRDAEAPGAPAPKFNLRITVDGLNGNNPTPIFGFSLGASNPTTIGSATGGAGAGKVKFKEFTIKKTIDKASPAFFRACATGSHYAKVTITVRKSGGDTTFDFGTVFVSGIKWVPADGPVNSLEEITFLAGSMKVTADGSVSCWDQVLNKSCDGSL